EMLTAITKLPDAAKDAPYPLQMTITGYETVANWPDHIEINLKGQTQNGLIDRYIRLQSIFNQMLYIDSNKDQYLFNWGVDSKRWTDELSAVQKTLQDVKDEVVSCHKNVDNCEMPGTLEQVHIYDFLIGIPIRKGSFPSDRQIRLDASGMDQKLSDFNSL